MRPPVLLAVAAAVSLAACSRKDGDAKRAQPDAREVATPEVAASAAAVAVPSAPKQCEHGVLADQCTRCNPDLVAVFKELGDWCDQHGVPESQCLKCNPKLRFDAPVVKAAGAPAEPWCKEHAAPEAKCTKCNPKLIAKFIAAGDFCREHGYPESVCPYCHPEKVKAAGHELPAFPEPGTKVRLASAETERKAGIETVRAESRPFARSIEVVGQLQFDQNRLSRLSARGEARVTEVKVDIGDAVKRGQPLVVLSSGPVGGAQSRLAAGKARLEAAQAAREREQALLASGISSRRDVEQAGTEAAAAKAEQDAARAELRAAGAGDAGSGGRYALTAPFDGTVVAREAAVGRAVGQGDILVEVADLRTVWAVLDVPEEQASAVRPGQRVTLRVEGSGEVREGRVCRVAAAVDPQTRAVRVRVDLPNRDGALRGGAFVRATIELAAPRAAVLVPRGAVQRAQGHEFVFVRTGPGQYEPVSVQLGSRTADAVEVAGGLAAGTEIVTTGAFLLKTEILKDSIGAGCADGH
ncbi:MAG: efflux transporter periplasmic adaptor subunit [Anaeromyxobacter sp. RBG_16_69_14]|nr:MAG: efflux transporter periplasmic adaptor subunit [Anaeromyxobacter sp. RBG_16_69_14]